jgi:cardiolipin synthase A/B
VPPSETDAAKTPADCDSQNTPNGRAGLREWVRTHPWWQTALLIAGLVAVLSVFGALFVGFGRAPTEVQTTGPVPPVWSPGFAAAMTHLVNAPLDSGGTVEVLNNGAGFLPALLQSIDEAETTINFLVFIWEDGEFSDQVLRALIRRQREGVAVRVLLDGYGGRGARARLFTDLEEAGGRVERFRMPRFGQLTRVHRRNHRRAIIVDGEVGFTGGMAIGDKWLGDARHPDEWRDAMFRMTGPLAHSLQAAFVHSWVSSTGEILLGPEFYPAPAAEHSGVRQFIHHVHSPADDDQSMAYFYLVSILAARERVYVATPYFIPDEPLKAALKDRARAGVDVRLLLPSEEIDNPFVRFSAQNHYDELIEAGVRIFEYQPTFMHNKFAVMDGQWSIIGSPNLNTRSRQLDEENAFGVLDEGLGRALEEDFLRDLGLSTEIQLEAWRQRGVWQRFMQFVSRALDEQS